MNGFKTLESLVKELEATQGEREIEKKLQEINATLRQFIPYKWARFTSNPCLEAYYCCDKFHDTTSHKNELQKERFGKLYYHHNSPNPTRNGLDVVLSCGDYYLLILLKVMLCDKITTRAKIYEIFQSLHKDAELINYLESLECLETSKRSQNAEVKLIVRINLSKENDKKRFAHKTLGSYLVKYKEKITELQGNYAKAVKES